LHQDAPNVQVEVFRSQVHDVQRVRDVLDQKARQQGFAARLVQVHVVRDRKIFPKKGGQVSGGLCRVPLADPFEPEKVVRFHEAGESCQQGVHIKAN